MHPFNYRVEITVGVLSQRVRAEHKADVGILTLRAIPLLNEDKVFGANVPPGLLQCLSDNRIL